MPNKPTPLFSIITVTYNAEQVIERTLKSVASQTYRHIQYIVIDGASTDRTVAIAKGYANEIAHLVSEPDKGLYDAMNKAIALATGDYLCFLNAGDCFCTEQTLQEIVDCLMASELPDIIYGDTALVDMDGRFLRMRHLSAPDKLTWKSFRQGMLVCHQAFFAKRSLVELYDLGYRFSSDFDWCIRVMKKSTTLHNTQQVLINYLSEGMTTTNRKASLIERFRIMAVHYGWVSTMAHHVWFTLCAIAGRRK